MAGQITREELIRELAIVSHATYVRQAMRDKGFLPEGVTEHEVTPHDTERAEDIVSRLVQLGVFD
jgi:hypothetical protein